MSSTITPNELKYWIAFNQTQIIGPKRFKQLIKHFPDLQTAWQADTGELIKAGLSEKTINKFIAKKNKINPDFELEKVKKNNISIVTILDKDYPELLAEIYSPPPLLYYKGRLNLNNDFPLAVVGTRKMTDYGREVCKNIVSELARNGLTIISGLALGIDAAAHQATVDVNGITIAVLGSGLNLIHPRTNYYLAEKIIQTGGAVISEFPLDTPPLKHNFPLRNRIISGLSLGVLVIEAGKRSGAWITAQCALDQNREIFAIPGNIYNPNSVGTNRLIKMGAKMVTGIADILQTLSLEEAQNFKKTKEVVPETKTEKVLLETLSNEPLHVDKIAQTSNLDISIINSTLAMMEMKGMIKNLGGQVYVKAR